MDAYLFSFSWRLPYWPNLGVDLHPLCTVMIAITRKRTMTYFLSIAECRHYLETIVVCVLIWTLIVSLIWWRWQFSLRNPICVTLLSVALYCLRISKMVHFCLFLEESPDLMCQVLLELSTSHSVSYFRTILGRLCIWVSFYCSATLVTLFAKQVCWYLRWYPPLSICWSLFCVNVVGTRSSFTFIRSFTWLSFHAQWSS